SEPDAAAPAFQEACRAASAASTVGSFEVPRSAKPMGRGGRSHSAAGARPPHPDRPGKEGAMRRILLLLGLCLVAALCPSRALGCRLWRGAAGGPAGTGPGANENPPADPGAHAPPANEASGAGLAEPGPPAPPVSAGSPFGVSVSGGLDYA